jgi:hypothetical protein
VTAVTNGVGHFTIGVWQNAHHAVIDGARFCAVVTEMDAQHFYRQ